MTQKANVNEDSEYTGENLPFSSPGNLADRRERSPYTLTWKVFLIRQATLRLLLSGPALLS